MQVSTLTTRILLTLVPASAVAAQLGIEDTPLTRGPLGHGPVNAAVAHPGNATDVLAARTVSDDYPGSNLMRSTDGGLTFEPQAAGSRHFELLLPDPVAAGRLWGMREEPSAPRAGLDLLVHSADFGLSWTTVSDPAIDALDGLAGRMSAAGSSVLVWGVLAAGDGYDGNLLQSTDGGASWSAIPASAPVWRNIEDAALAPSNASRIYLWADVGGGNFELFRSDDAGVTFSSVWVWPYLGGAGAWDDDRFIAVHPTQPDTVVVGDFWSDRMWRSTDGGVTFTLLAGMAGTVPLREINTVQWDADGGALWAQKGSAGNGGFYSLDDGATWVAAAGCSSVQPGDSLATRRWRPMSHDSTGRRVLLGCEGVLRMPSGTPTSWEVLSFPAGEIEDLLVTEPGGLQLATRPHNQLLAGGSGVPLAPLGPPQVQAVRPGLAVDPCDPDRWLVARSAVICLDFVGCWSRLQTWVATGGGTSWVQGSEPGEYNSEQGFTVRHAFDPNDSSRAVRAAWDDHDTVGPFGSSLNDLAAEMSVSSDGGLTWADAGMPGTNVGIRGAGGDSLVFDRHTPGRVLLFGERLPGDPAGPGAAWVESLDGGLNWGAPQTLRSMAGAGDVIAGGFDPLAPGIMLAGDTLSGVRLSIDDGATWHPVGATLRADSDILFHPEIPGLLWVSDAAGVVQVSGWYGTSFEPASTSQGPLRATRLALDTLDGTLLFGTSEDGAWALEDASPFVVRGEGTAGTGGAVPRHRPLGGLPRLGNAAFEFAGERTVGGALVIPVLGFAELPFATNGGTWYVDLFTLPWVMLPALVADGTPGAAGAGTFRLPFGLPADPTFAGGRLFTQCVAVDPGAADPSGLVLTDALVTTLLP
jgi:hypothetical protein